MEVEHKKGAGRYTLSMERSELVAINNALNEVCNGIDIDDWEFETRLGMSREELRQVLQEVTALLGSAPGRGEA